MSKLSKFVSKVLNANGPAQIVSYSFWGVLVAGVLWDYCDDCLPNALLASWGGVSALVLVSAIWLPRKATIALLWLDMVLSAIVLSIYAMHEPHYVSQMVYNVAADGVFQKVELSITTYFTDAMLVWMTAHSAYLANLLQRQELESRRFHSGV